MYVPDGTKRTNDDDDDEAEWHFLQYKRSSPPPVHPICPIYVPLQDHSNNTDNERAIQCVNQA